MEVLKAFRLTIDKFINSIPLLEQSPEVTLAKRELQRAKMWLGKAMGELGNKTPYPESDNAASAVIEPQAEHTEDSLKEDFDSIFQKDEFQNTPSNIFRIKHMRSEIENKVKEFNDIMEDLVEKNHTLNEYFLPFAHQSYMALIESKMWLGMELDRIRSEAVKV